MAGVRTRPGGLCLRIVPQPDNGEFAYLENGGFEALFASAGRHSVPILAWLPGRSQALVPYLEKFTDTRVVLDHIGLGGAALSPDDRDRQFQDVLSLARYPNFVLKWCHAPQRFAGQQSYPFSHVLPYLRQAIDALGAERIMWASDHTQSKSHHTWAEALYCLLDAQSLSQTEKEWILGGTARTILRWPKPADMTPST
jgi:L-fuconolactonase